MRRLIRAHGPCTLVPEPRPIAFESLVRAVAHQQLTAPRRRRFSGGFSALFPGKRFPSAKALAKSMTTPCARAAFRGRKSPSFRDIAAKTLDGTVPDLARDSRHAGRGDHRAARAGARRRAVDRRDAADLQARSAGCFPGRRLRRAQRFPSRLRVARAAASPRKCSRTPSAGVRRARLRRGISGARPMLRKSGRRSKASTPEARNSDAAWFDSTAKEKSSAFARSRHDERRVND